MPYNRHDWQINSIGGPANDVPAVVAACRRCGEIRMARLIGMNKPRQKLDLTGGCLGEE